MLGEVMITGEVLYTMEKKSMQNIIVDSITRFIKIWKYNSNIYCVFITE